MDRVSASEDDTHQPSKRSTRTRNRQIQALALRGTRSRLYCALLAAGRTPAEANQVCDRALAAGIAAVRS